MIDEAKLRAAREQVRHIQQVERQRKIDAGEPLIRCMSLSELMAMDPDPHFFSIDRAENTLHVYWGGYDYEVDLAEVGTPLQLLQWVSHIAEKEWELTTGYRVARLIESVCRVKGWDLHGSRYVPADAKAERAKMTPQLRWRVFGRDGHACRACGGTPATGAVLHVDHIQPVSKGGLTELDNLQTLCAACNFGKGAS